MISRREMAEFWDEGWCAYAIACTSTHTIMVMPFIYTTAIITVVNGTLSFEDRWCYGHLHQAVEAAWEWLASDEAEPAGWHRHPSSGRRRKDGDPAQEYVWA